MGCSGVGVLVGPGEIKGCSERGWDKSPNSILIGSSSNEALSIELILSELQNLSESTCTSPLLFRGAL